MPRHSRGSQRTTIPGIRPRSADWNHKHSSPWPQALSCEPNSHYSVGLDLWARPSSSSPCSLPRKTHQCGWLVASQSPRPKSHHTSHRERRAEKSISLARSSNIHRHLPWVRPSYWHASLSDLPQGPSSHLTQSYFSSFHLPVSLPSYCVTPLPSLYRHSWSILWTHCELLNPVTSSSLVNT